MSECPNSIWALSACGQRVERLSGSGMHVGLERNLQIGILFARGRGSFEKEARSEKERTMSGKRTTIRWAILLAIVLMSGLSAHAQDAGWKQLWNGKDFTGWKHVGPGKFVIEKGLLKSVGGMGLLWYTPRKFGDCTIRVVYKTQKKNDNSGVFIRIPEKPSEEWMPVNKGYEVQIDDSMDDYHVTGVLYSLTRAKARPGETGKWNTMDITIAGPRTTVTLNGVEVTDYTEGQPVPKKEKSYEPDRGPRPNAGYIGLQNHSDSDTVFFKKIEVRPLEH
jgi:hypothetical protein